MLFISINFQDWVFILILVVTVDAKHAALPLDYLVPILAIERLVHLVDIVRIGIAAVFDKIGPS